MARGPLPLSTYNASALSVAPTENALGLLAGLTLSLELPEANTGRMPATRSTRKSGSKVKSQPPTLDNRSHELLTICGASCVAGSLSGSSTH